MRGAGLRSRCRLERAAGRTRAGAERLADGSADADRVAWSRCASCGRATRPRSLAALTDDEVHAFHLAAAADHRRIRAVHRVDAPAAHGRQSASLRDRAARADVRHRAVSGAVARVRFRDGRVGLRDRVGVLGHRHVRRRRAAGHRVRVRRRSASTGSKRASAVRNGARQRRAAKARRGARRRAAQVVPAPRRVSRSVAVDDPRRRVARRAGWPCDVAGTSTNMTRGHGCPRLRLRPSPELIAQEPPPDARRVRACCVSTATARSLTRTRTSARCPICCAPAICVVVNNTRVFPARLLGRRVPSGGAVECLLVDAPGVRSDGQTVGVRPGSDRCQTSGRRPRAVGGAGAPGAETETGGAGGVSKEFTRCTARSSSGGSSAGALVRLWTDDGIAGRRGGRRHRPRAAAAVHQARRPRRRPRSLSDRLRARARLDRRADRRPPLHAAPLIAALAARGVELAAITLHVGYGTFQPVRVDRVEDHRLEPERYEIDARGRGARSTARATTAAASSPSARRRRGRSRRWRARTTARIVAGDGATDLFIYPGLRLPRRRRPADELPPAAVVAADARVGVRRPRARHGRVSMRRSPSATASTATATRC